MRVLREIPKHPLFFQNVVTAIGIFDGVHLGHQAILKKAVSRARALSGTAAAVTFHPHPLSVLKPSLVPDPLLSLEDRLKVFEELGIQAALVIPFTRSFSRWSHQDFIRRLLVKVLSVREVVVGHDFGFGRGRRGSVSTLRLLGAEAGFKTHVVAPVRVAGHRVSSAGIREKIRQGELNGAAASLGRPVFVVGRVVRGSGRGKRLGVPTANLRVMAGVLPREGVYAVRAQVHGRWYGGMANLGVRPTFDGGKGKEAPLLEVHLFGQHRSLYGAELKVQFVRRLRAERRFPSPKALIRQLARDATRAEALLRKAKLPLQRVERVVSS